MSPRDMGHPVYGLSKNKTATPKGGCFVYQRVCMSYSRSLRFQLIRSPSVVLEELEVLEEAEALDL